ncbi:MAG: AraC family transcriptional regulator, partial [Oscillospiraceae bacterium]
MPEIIKLQNPLGSVTDGDKICSFNSEVIESVTKPLIHQSARFWLINKGDATAIIKGKAVHLISGTLVSVLPWEITEIVQVKIPLQYFVVIYHFDALNILIKSFYNQSNDAVKLLKGMEENPAVYCSKKQYSKIFEVFLELKNELGLDTAIKTVEPQILSSIFITNHLVTIMVEFLRISCCEGVEIQTEPFKKEEILQYIYSHLSENITAKHLSKIFYMSESRISQYIKQLTGLSVVSLCHEMRIVKVSDFLLFTDFNLEELAGILGYADASHISKVF